MVQGILTFMEARDSGQHSIQYKHVKNVFLILMVLGELVILMKRVV